MFVSCVRTFCSPLQRSPVLAAQRHIGVLARTVLRRADSSSSSTRQPVSWHADGETFEVPPSMNQPVASPFGSTGKLVEERVLPSTYQLNEQLPSAEELKQRLERGESIEEVSDATKDDDE